MTVACDDGRVSKLGEGVTVVACVSYTELRPSGVRLGLIHVDGLDATSVIGELVRELAAGRRGVILLDSLTIAGFNVISLPGLLRLTGLPSLVVYAYEPSIRRLEEPLRAHFKDAELRLRALEPLRSPSAIKTARGPLYVVTWGVEVPEAKALIEAYQIYTRVPEPLRVAHRVASEASSVLMASERRPPA